MSAPITAADEKLSAALEARVAELETALVPFGDLYDDYIDGNEDQAVDEPCVVIAGRFRSYALDISHFRRASTTLWEGKA